MTVRLVLAIIAAVLAVCVLLGVLDVDTAKLLAVGLLCVAVGLVV